MPPSRHFEFVAAELQIRPSKNGEPSEEAFKFRRGQYFWRRRRRRREV